MLSSQVTYCYIISVIFITSRYISERNREQGLPVTVSTVYNFLLLPCDSKILYEFLYLIFLYSLSDKAVLFTSCPDRFIQFSVLWNKVFVRMTNILYSQLSVLKGLYLSEKNIFHVVLYSLQSNGVSV